MAQHLPVLLQTWDTTTETINLTQPEEFEISIMQSGEISCYGGNNGSLSVSTTGGNTGNVIYTWNTGQSSPSTSINNLSAQHMLLLTH